MLQIEQGMRARIVENKPHEQSKWKEKGWKKESNQEWEKKSWADNTANNGFWNNKCNNDWERQAWIEKTASKWHRRQMLVSMIRMRVGEPDAQEFDCMRLLT